MATGENGKLTGKRKLGNRGQKWEYRTDVIPLILCFCVFPGWDCFCLGGQSCLGSWACPSWRYHLMPGITITVNQYWFSQDAEQVFVCQMPRKLNSQSDSIMSFLLRSVLRRFSEADTFPDFLFYTTPTAYVLSTFVHTCTVSSQHKDSRARSYSIYLPQPFVCSHGWETRKNAWKRKEWRKRKIPKISFCNIQLFPEQNTQPISSRHYFHVLLQSWKGQELPQKLLDLISVSNSALCINET